MMETWIVFCILNYRERGKEFWTEDDEAELYKEPSHTDVNTMREDL